MKVDEYFKYGLKQKYYRYKSWILGCFSIVTEDVSIKLKQQASIDLDDTQDTTLVIIKVNGGFKSVLVDKEYVKIDNVDIKEPMMDFHASIKLEPGDLPNVTEPVTTTYGRAIANAILLTNNFEDKIPYINGHMKVGDIEDIIASRLEDNIPKDQRDKGNKQKIYVDEYTKFVDSCLYMTGLSQICVHSGSALLLKTAPGFKEFKEKTIKKYEGKLNDPVQLIAFENELKAFDREYIKNDPSYGIFMNPKQCDVARKKMFLNLGADGSFDEKQQKIHPVINSLEQGWPNDPDQFTDLINGMRVGTFGRGKDTIKGGVLAKAVLRAAGSLAIVNEDCGTTKGVPMLVTEQNAKRKIGRYMRVKDRWVLIDSIDVIKPYINKIVVFRSPMYCRCEGTNICHLCVGATLALNPRGIATALTDVSGVILQADMDAVHGTVMSTATIDLHRCLS